MFKHGPTTLCCIASVGMLGNGGALKDGLTVNSGDASRNPGGDASNNPGGTPVESS